MRPRRLLIAAAATSASIIAAAVTAAVRVGVAPAPRLPTQAEARELIQQPLTTGFITAAAQLGGAVLAALLLTTCLAHLYRRCAQSLRWLPAVRLPGP
ncbi:hypothetical protein, partial [Micromonospora sp. NPDC050200]|uniref:hypothetical protein n=1 Tax=Micromonospora sp. NPDC050200 TaxID=3155664 RepID=UPI003410E5B1